MLAARSGVKNLRVLISFGGLVTGANAPVVTAFLEVKAASVVFGRFRFRTSWNPAS
jgi:hypothetical protein